MEKNQIETNPFYTFESRDGYLSRIIKFIEHFFTHHTRPPHQEKKKGIDMNLTRIDFVFSENYDEIFIGIINTKKTSYEQTF